MSTETEHLEVKAEENNDPEAPNPSTNPHYQAEKLSPNKKPKIKETTNHILKKEIIQNVMFKYTIDLVNSI